MRLHFTRKQCELIDRSLDEVLRHGIPEEDIEIVETIKAKIAKEMAPRKDK